LLASLAGGDRVALWDVADPVHAARIATLPGRGGFLSALAFSPDGGLLAGVGYHGIVTMFSLADLTHRNVASCDGNSSLPLISPDGRTVASGAPFGFFGVTLRVLSGPARTGPGR
jgi:WD40 repeat protein